jgi:hypothetical protein
MNVWTNPTCGEKLKALLMTSNQNRLECICIGWQESKMGRVEARNHLKFIQN